MAGPGDKLKTIERIKPNKEIQSPKNEDLIIAILRLCALSRPNNVGVDNKAITRITPTADIELTITSAVVKLRARFNNCLLYTSPSPRDRYISRMPSSA